jgi:hypothetical protein
MRPFDFIILFFSFAYTLALTHLLFAATRMIRHRRALAFSWPHGLWMLSALMLLLANWISLWDFHAQERLPLGLVLTGFLMVTILYFICGLVAPDFEEGESFDLRAFHDREGPTYISAFAVLAIVSVGANFLAGAAAGVQNWSDQNLLTVVLLPVTIGPLFVKARWVQVGAPLLVAVSTFVFLAGYYPVLA